MTRQTISSALEKRVGDVADQDFVALPEDMLVGVAVKIMRNRDVSSILVSKFRLCSIFGLLLVILSTSFLKCP